MSHQIRPNFIDYAKVIMIYMVVLGHYTYRMEIPFTQSPIWALMHSITLFHMPFFFIVSGIFYKTSDTKNIVRKGLGTTSCTISFNEYVCWSYDNLIRYLLLKCFTRSIVDIR